MSARSLSVSLGLSLSIVVADAPRAESPPPSVVDAVEVWRRGGEGDELYFGRVRNVRHDQSSNVYLLDGQSSEIHVLSAAGDHLRTIGREGDGPGEFRGAVDFWVEPDGAIGVVQMFPAKTVHFHADGTPRDAPPFQAIEAGDIRQLFEIERRGDGFVVAAGREDSEGGGQRQVKFLALLTSTGALEKILHEESMLVRFDGMRYDERRWSNLVGRWCTSPSGRAAAVSDFDRYRVLTWEADGSPSALIDRPDHPPVRRTRSEIEQTQKLYDGFTRWNTGLTFEVSDTHRVLSRLWFRSERLWVLSGRGARDRPPGHLMSVDVYDPSSTTLVEQLHLRCDGDPQRDALFVVDDRLYRVTRLYDVVAASVDADDAEDEGEAPLQLVAYDLE